MVDLKDFVNGQALANVAAWRLEGEDSASSLEDLLPGMSPKVVFSRVELYYSDTASSLWKLTEEWKIPLVADWQQLERLEGSYSTAILFWLEQTAPSPREGSQVCVYCGAVCATGTAGLR